MKTIRVIAVVGRRLPFEGGVGRFVGRDQRNAIALDGDEVPASPYYQRAIARGDLAVESDEQQVERESRAKKRAEHEAKLADEAAQRAKDSAQKQAKAIEQAANERAQELAASEPAAVSSDEKETTS